MNSFGANHRILTLSKEEDLPLDKVLKHRQTGKKLPELFSSQSEVEKEQDSVKKSKLILKEQKDIKPKEFKEQNNPIIQQQVSSTELVKQLILDQQITIKQAQNIMIRLKSIKSLKYDKLSERIRENLIEVRFKNSYESFVKIISGYTKDVGSTHLIHAIFHGFELAWRWEKFESIECYDDFLKLYVEKVPCCLNKRFAKWMKERLFVSIKKSIYLQMRQRIQQFVKGVVTRNNKRQQNSTQNEKIIGLVVYFELWDTIDMKQLVKIVPLEKINEYIDNDDDQVKKQQSVQLDSDKIKGKMEIQKGKDVGNDERKVSSQQQSSSSQQRHKADYKGISIPPLIHHSILQLIHKNNLKQVQKLLKSHKISHYHYPEYIQKLQMKYLQYAQRINPIYVIDELIHGKVNLVENLIDIYIRKRKYDHAEHFMHKYRLRNVDLPDTKRIFVNPLKCQDSFGPTESHVLNQQDQTHFLRLLDFDVPKSNVVWIDSLTIFQKQFTSHLKKLIFAKQVGLDSESSSAIHVFDKARLEIIQIYEPQSNVVFLFDVRDFKNDKKKRNRKQNSNKTVKKQSNSQKLGSSITQAIDLQQNNTKENNNLDEQNKAWYRFTKIIENVFRNATIFGHVLHSDLGEIISGLNLNIKTNKLKIKDSQVEFKKYYPNETKSKLSFLTEKCFGKEISKFEQCGAWDKRPLRNAQKHYAALDAVLPYKLVKWMQERFPASKTS